MRLGSKMDNRVGPMLREQPPHKCRVADVAVDEGVPRRLDHARQRLEIARIGQLVEINDPRVSVGENASHERAANKARTASNEEIPHVGPIQLTTEDTEDTE